VATWYTLNENMKILIKHPAFFTMEYSGL